MRQHDVVRADAVSAREVVRIVVLVKRLPRATPSAEHPPRAHARRCAPALRPDTRSSAPARQVRTRNPSPDDSCDGPAVLRHRCGTRVDLSKPVAQPGALPEITVHRAFAFISPTAGCTLHPGIAYSSRATHLPPETYPVQTSSRALPSPTRIPRSRRCCMMMSTVVWMSCLLVSTRISACSGAS